MVKKINLDAKTREKSSASLGDVRKEGFVPGVVYGPEMKPHSLLVKKVDLKKAYEAAGESALVNLKIDDKDPLKVIIKEMQTEPLKNEILHVDFYKVNMKRMLEVEIPLVFIGESKAEKELGGTLIKGMEKLQVKCLPGDLVDHIEVNISVLKTYDDTVKVKDLQIPADYEVMDDPEMAIAHIIEPQVEKVEAAPAAPADAEASKPAKETAPAEQK